MEYNKGYSDKVYTILESDLTDLLGKKDAEVFALVLTIEIHGPTSCSMFPS